MKRFEMCLCLVLALGVSASSAEEQILELPEIQAPKELSEEGLETRLDETQIARVKDWVSSSKLKIEDLLAQSALLAVDPARALVLLEVGIRGIIEEEAGKESSTFVLYTLRRGLKILEILRSEVPELEASSLAMSKLALTLLEESCRFAMKYYESDLAHLSAGPDDSSSRPFAQYGIDFAHFINTKNKSVVDASAQRRLSLLTIGLFQWDLYRDQNRTLYAYAIKKISDFLLQADQLEEAGLGPQNDRERIQDLQRIHMVYQQALELAKEQRLEANPVFEQEEQGQEQLKGRPTREPLLRGIAFDNPKIRGQEFVAYTGYEVYISSEYHSSSRADQFCIWQGYQQGSLSHSVKLIPECQNPYLFVDDDKELKEYMIRHCFYEGHSSAVFAMVECKL